MQIWGKSHFQFSGNSTGASLPGMRVPCYFTMNLYQLFQATAPANSESILGKKYSGIGAVVTFAVIRLIFFISRAKDGTDCLSGVARFVVIFLSLL